MASRPPPTGPLRVTHVITGLGTGGAEHSLLKLVRGMDRGRFRNAVVALTPPGALAPAIEAAGVSVRSLGMRRGLPSPAALLRLVRWLRAERAHVVQTWLPHADLLGGLAARLAGRPPVVWNIRYTQVQDPLRHPAPAWSVRACAALSRRLPVRIVSCTERGAAFSAALGYDEARLVVIPNGFDTRYFRPDAEARAALRAELGLPEGAVLVGLVARYDPLKDQPGFLAAARQVAERHPAAHFLLCGGGIGWDNAALAAAIGENRERFHLLGPQEDVHRVLAALDVHVLSSVSEGFPNVVAEAMACGVPGVVTDVGDAALIVGDTGRVVPPRDPAALADGIAALIGAGAEQRCALGSAARERIETAYGLEAMVKRYEELYEELAGHVRN